MDIFDANGKKLEYTVKQVEDHPEYSHDATVYEEVKLDIGAVTSISDAESFDFKEYPRVDVYLQVNWVQDLYYLQLADEEKPSAQEKLVGAKVNVYQEKTDEEGKKYYELIQTCETNENGTLIAEGLEEFTPYLFVPAGYDEEKHEAALNPESSGVKIFDKKHTFDPDAEEPVTVSEEEMENYFSIPYHYNEKNSTITNQVVALTDMVTETMLYHELWMQVDITKYRYYTDPIDETRQGIYKITKTDSGYHYGISTVLSPMRCRLVQSVKVANGVKKTFSIILAWQKAQQKEQRLIIIMMELWRQFFSAGSIQDRMQNTIFTA